MNACENVLSNVLIQRHHVHLNIKNHHFHHCFKHCNIIINYPAIYIQNISLTIDFNSFKVYGLTYKLFLSY